MVNESVINKDLGALPTKGPQTGRHINDLFSLKGKVASITGSSGGIGWAVAEAYAQSGADVAIWYNSKPAEDKAAYLEKTYGVKAKAYKCNVSSFEDVQKTILSIEKEFGGLDIFVANAGVPWTAGKSVEAENPIEEWSKVIDLDLSAVYYCATVAGKIFKKNGKGSFIITASMSGHIVNVPQLQAPYNAAKAACIHLSKSLAVEWAAFARVNSVSPGYIRTEISDFVPDDIKGRWHSLTPLGREGETQELVGAYVYLASDASTYTTGTDILVDGGYTLP
ncbi:NAD(P)-binding protein [Metschnikowia bicuspidata var. bicuspidata NRRL YB-4993]|uniref:NAD(P)-binding protein n=1 Tax=Metschnikowia bicuspidata var. bicuspidata NRRL YB-4993 TaxID=869754 RepID=A0A1A0HL00_9ASCO|nr:NAD(P)-binding protein [Metschnikowia bicuspidata var. bicuspidata NRRL YB-4993]OBA24483.1 NAD(P)-binding protein [Metschnikowia bicuspidata var. bicuspidata NRRL YB-4993]